MVNVPIDDDDDEIEKYCDNLDSVSRVSHSSYLAGCNLSGTLPPQWSTMSGLERLYESMRRSGCPPRFDLFKLVTCELA